MISRKKCRIAASDLFTIIEDVGFGKVTIGDADRRGIVIDGYLDLAGIADRINALINIEGTFTIPCSTTSSRARCNLQSAPLLPRSSSSS